MEESLLNTLKFRLVSAASILFFVAGPALGASGSVTYTTDAEFDQGTLINVNHDAPNNDQLQLNDSGEALSFIWVAASLRGTIVKIDTETGAIPGEYQSAPNGRARNPSRTTVDANGNVWAGNRDEADGNRGSVVHIGLVENGQCEDRNGRKKGSREKGVREKGVRVLLEGKRGQSTFSLLLA